MHNSLLCSFIHWGDKVSNQIEFHLFVFGQMIEEQVLIHLPKLENNIFSFLKEVFPVH